MNPVSPTEDDNLARLRRIDTCALSDALDKLRLPGVVMGLVQQSGSGRIAGLADTIKVGVGQPAPGPAKHLGCSAIEQSSSANIIVVEQRSGIDAGCWGGLLTLGAKVRGVAGVVAEGPLRDVDEAMAYGFPVFSRSLTARTARSRVVELGTQVPVQIGDALVIPGDYVLADRSAVVFVAAAHIQEVLAAAEMITGKEAAMAKSILAGTPIGEVMGGNYEHMLEK
jgi:regulator of RNase E activity RraA